MNARHNIVASLIASAPVPFRNWETNKPATSSAE